MKYYFLVLVVHIPYALDMNRPTDEKYLKEFGRHLADLREGRGMSQEKLGAAAGLSRETISNIENGRQWAKLGTLHSIAKALKVPTKDLLDGLKQ